MKELMFKALIEIILAYATPELIKKVIDGVLDLVEDYVEKSENKTDDQIVLPICERLRSVLGVPDND